MIKIGDIVRYLNAVGGGQVVRIEGNIAVVDDDGFETPVLLKECVVVGHVGDNKTKSTPKPEVAAVAPSVPKHTPEVTSPIPQKSDDDEEEEIVETPEGDSLNVVLAFTATDIKRLSHSHYEAYLVNDSNYYLYFTLLTRSEQAPDNGWQTRYAGIVEPNIQVFMAEIAPDELVDYDRVAVQYIAFKRGRTAQLKAPGAVEYKLDTTKFFKLHCFRDNLYFDEPVIALDIVKDDVPVTPQVRVNASDLEREMRRKKSADSRPTRRPVVKRHTRKADDGKIEVDLHIHELVDTTRGLSAADMLNLQVDEFRRVMDANLKNHGLRLIFIHGKGEGVLRNALMKELKHRYKGHDVQDASFAEYGFGATQVTIR